MATAFVRGTLELIPFEHNGQTLEELCQSVLISIKPKLGHKLSGYRDYTEKLLQGFCEEYLVLDGLLYKVTKEELRELFLITSYDKYRIDYILKYNDSGCAFEDAMEYALEDKQGS